MKARSACAHAPALTPTTSGSCYVGQGWPTSSRGQGPSSGNKCWLTGALPAPLAGCKKTPGWRWLTGLPNSPAFHPPGAGICSRICPTKRAICSTEYSTDNAPWGGRPASCRRHSTRYTDHPQVGLGKPSGQLRQGRLNDRLLEMAPQPLIGSKTKACTTGLPAGGAADARVRPPRRPSANTRVVAKLDGAGVVAKRRHRAPVLAGGRRDRGLHGSHRRLETAGAPDLAAQRDRGVGHSG
jgi:hypothetical protein